MSHNRLQGKKYVNLLRCSTADQVGTSIEDQRTVNNAFARRVGLVHVLDKVSAAVSGSKTFNRSDITELEEMRRSGTKFDVVLVHDLSRLTRGGISHAYELKRQFARLGVEVVSVGDSLPDGDESDLIESITHYKNHRYSKDLSRASCRRLYTSLVCGTRPPSAHTPYGYDRLYIGSDGRPTALLQNTGDGGRRVLDPVTLQLRHVLEKGADGRSPHFLKQKGERSELVLGAEDRVAVVRWMFRKHYIDGWGCQRIARDLNERHIPAPNTKKWSITTAQRIYRNPVYVGQAVACRTSKGSFFKLAPETPSEVCINQAKLEEEKRRAIPSTKRPSHEWVRPQHAPPALIVDEEVLAVAVERIDAYWRRWEQCAASTESHDRHPESRYFLKSVLRSRQGNFAMSGRTTGSPKKFRYYIASKAWSYGKLEPELRRHVPAEPLERAVLDVLKEVFSNSEDVANIVLAHVRQQISSTEEVSDTRASLEKREAKLTKRLDLIYSTAEAEDLERLKETIMQLKDERTSLRAQLSMKNGRSAPDLKPEEIAEAVKRQLHDLRGSVESLPMRHLNRLIALFFTNLVVDVETRELTFDLRLPRWAYTDLERVLCLDARPYWKTPVWAQSPDDVKIASYVCEFIKRSAPSDCYTCRRSSRASNPIQRAAA